MTYFENEFEKSRTCVPVRLARESLWGGNNLFLRICRSIPGEVVIVFLLYFLIQKRLVKLVSSAMIKPAMALLLGDSFDALRTPVLALGEITMLAGFMIYVRLAQRRGFPAMGFIRKEWWQSYLTGFGCGLALFCVALLLSIAMTGGKIAYSGNTTPGMFLFAMFGWIVQGMAEEVEGRGYLFLSVSRCHKEYAGVLLSGLFFGLIHANNSGATPLSVINTTLWGILFCLLFIVAENIWFIGALHSSWNLAQGNIFGISVSGTNPGASMFQVQLFGNNDILTGGAYGIEGNMATMIVLVAMIAVSLIMIYKRNH